MYGCVCTVGGCVVSAVSSARIELVCGAADAVEAGPAVDAGVEKEPEFSPNGSSFDAAGAADVDDEPPNIKVMSFAAEDEDVFEVVGAAVEVLGAFVDPCDAQSNEISRSSPPALLLLL